MLSELIITQGCLTVTLNDRTCFRAVVQPDLGVFIIVATVVINSIGLNVAI